MVPTLDAPPSTPFTSQDTAELNAPVPITETANSCVPAVGTDADVGDTETEVIVGDGGGGGWELPPPQP